MTDTLALPVIEAPRGRAWAVAVDFVAKQAAACLFAVLIFVGIAVTAAVDLPWPRYDVLLAYGLIVTGALWALRLETSREVGIIFAFHALGLALEIFKVSQGSWAYPDEGSARLLGVPLYAGFMYAAVGSYIVQAWRRFDLRLTEYRPVAVTAIAALLYANFYSHHFLPDARWVLAFALLVVLGRTEVHFSVGGRRRRMPLSVALGLIGVALWVAENAGTLLGAWQYPHQADVWHMVHVGKMGSWGLLVALSFALIATVKMGEGRLYGSPADHASVRKALASAPSKPAAGTGTGRGRRGRRGSGTRSRWRRN